MLNRRLFAVGLRSIFCEFAYAVSGPNEDYGAYPRTLQRIDAQVVNGAIVHVTLF